MDPVMLGAYGSDEIDNFTDVWAELPDSVKRVIRIVFAFVQYILIHVFLIFCIVALSLVHLLCLAWIAALWVETRLLFATAKLLDFAFDHPGVRAAEAQRDGAKAASSEEKRTRKSDASVETKGKVEKELPSKSLESEAAERFKRQNDVPNQQATPIETLTAREKPAQAKSPRRQAKGAEDRKEQAKSSQKKKSIASSNLSIDSTPSSYRVSEKTNNQHGSEGDNEVQKTPPAPVEPVKGHLASPKSAENQPRPTHVQDSVSTRASAWDSETSWDSRAGTSFWDAGNSWGGGASTWETPAPQANEGASSSEPSKSQAKAATRMNSALSTVKKQERTASVASATLSESSTSAASLTPSQTFQAVSPALNSTPAASAGRFNNAAVVADATLSSARVTKCHSKDLFDVHQGPLVRGPSAALGIGSYPPSKQQAAPELRARLSMRGFNYRRTPPAGALKGSTGRDMSTTTALPKPTASPPVPVRNTSTTATPPQPAPSPPVTEYDTGTANISSKPIASPPAEHFKPSLEPPHLRQIGLAKEKISAQEGKTQAEPLSPSPAGKDTKVAAKPLEKKYGLKASLLDASSAQAQSSPKIPPEDGSQPRGLSSWSQPPSTTQSNLQQFSEPPNAVSDSSAVYLSPHAQPYEPPNVVHDSSSVYLSPHAPSYEPKVPLGPAGTSLSSTTQEKSSAPASFIGSSFMTKNHNPMSLPTMTNEDFGIGIENSFAKDLDISEESRKLSAEAKSFVPPSHSVQTANQGPTNADANTTPLVYRLGLTIFTPQGVAPASNQKQIDIGGKSRRPSRSSRIAIVAPEKAKPTVSDQPGMTTDFQTAKNLGLYREQSKIDFNDMVSRRENLRNRLAGERLTRSQLQQCNLAAKKEGSRLRELPIPPSDNAAFPELIGEDAYQAAIMINDLVPAMPQKSHRDAGKACLDDEDEASSSFDEDPSDEKAVFPEINQHMSIAHQLKEKAGGEQRPTTGGAGRAVEKNMLDESNENLLLDFEDPGLKDEKILSNNEQTSFEAGQASASAEPGRAESCETGKVDGKTCAKAKNGVVNATHEVKDRVRKDDPSRSGTEDGTQHNDSNNNTEHKKPFSEEDKARQAIYVSTLKAKTLYLHAVRFLEAGPRANGLNFANFKEQACAKLGRSTKFYRHKREELAKAYGPEGLPDDVSQEFTERSEQDLLKLWRTAVVE